ncbi:MAG: hypothetical protein M3O46_00115 [Myxococcota bacterium]|nr:hypothetical protein [Myxococcota bacterium]
MKSAAPGTAGRPTYKTIIQRFAEAAGTLLRALEVEEAKMASEGSAMQDYVVTTTNDRRVSDP